MNSLVAADYGDSTSDENLTDDERKLKSKTPTESYKTNTKLDSDIDNNTDDDSSSNSDESTKMFQNQTKVSKNTLPSASALLSNVSSTGQVFNNPYKRAENAQIASLEKHVKMVDTDVHTQMKNGKKICWNYRKGRCRFGSNCTYAHDSDLHVNDNNLLQNDAGSSQTSNDEKSKKSLKKRPGLSDSIVPSKKVMQTYNSMKK